MENLNKVIDKLREEQLKFAQTNIKLEQDNEVHDKKAQIEAAAMRKEKEANQVKLNIQLTRNKTLEKEKEQLIV